MCGRSCDALIAIQESKNLTNKTCVRLLENCEQTRCLSVKFSTCLNSVCSLYRMRCVSEKINTYRCYSIPLIEIRLQEEEEEPKLSLVSSLLITLYFSPLHVCHIRRMGDLLLDWKLMRKANLFFKSSWNQKQQTIVMHTKSSPLGSKPTKPNLTPRATVISTMSTKIMPTISHPHRQPPPPLPPKTTTPMTKRP